jgi:hypothetical protein
MRSAELPAAWIARRIAATPGMRVRITGVQRGTLQGWTVRLLELWAIAQVVSLVWAVAAWWSSPKPSREELERASMRSSSWPGRGLQARGGYSGDQADEEHK